MKKIKIALIGAGNLGASIIKGLDSSGFLRSNELTYTRKKSSVLNDVTGRVSLTANNSEAVSSADVIIICVQPYQMSKVLEEIKTVVTSGQTIVSAVTGVKIAEMESLLGQMPIVRAMPNTAIAVRESMTCLSANEAGADKLSMVQSIFDELGQTTIIEEQFMQAATIICASGTAFWMRFIRASCQGAVQLGFEAELAQKLVTQTCLGAAELLKVNNTHPEQEIDKVTTPAGCTVKGLNEMEHQGLSSAIIKGMEKSFDQIGVIRERK